MRWLIIVHFALISLNTQAQEPFDPDSSYQVGDVFILEGVYFELDSDSIRPESDIALDEMVEYLKSRSIFIEIGVHCDERVSDAYSIWLTSVRANALKRNLVRKGIASNKIEAKGYQDTKPRVPNAKTEAEHQMNRRIEITILEKKD